MLATAVTREARMHACGALASAARVELDRLMDEQVALEMAFTKAQRLAVLRQGQGKDLHSDAMGYMLAAQNFPDTARGRQQAWKYRCYAMEAQRMAAASYADARRVLGVL